MKSTSKAASASTANTACITTDGVRVEVERVGVHSTVHGQRSARVYVRIRPVGSTSGLDAGPRTSLSFALDGAYAVGALLQSAAAGRSAA
jgi:hypothetical protein